MFQPEKPVLDDLAAVEADRALGERRAEALLSGLEDDDDAGGET